MTDKFERRHNGPDETEIEKMLQTIGVQSLDQLIDETVPALIRMPMPLDMPPALSEQEMLEELKFLASKNKVFKSYIGMGYYDCITPPVILRNIMENPGWYTAYTPYQAEIAQGRLEMLINFQTMVMDLTGMEIANASLLDEATAAAEAMHMLWELRGKEKGNTFFISEKCFPQTIDVVFTRATPLGIKIVIGDHNKIEYNSDLFGILLQYPDGNGLIEDYTGICKKAHEHGVSVAVAADLMSLALLTPPGEWGADVVVGSTQRFGVPLGYGGPHAAYFATKDEFKRQMPGRIIGVSIDANGNQAYRMALQTREQHIRREKATSNICTAQVLLAVMAGAYSVYHGAAGVRSIAKKIHANTVLLALSLTKLGYKQANPAFFDTLHISEIDGQLAAKIKYEMVSREINLRYFDNNDLGISLDETTNLKDVNELIAAFATAKGVPAITVGNQEFDEKYKVEYNEVFTRKSPYLTHPIFNMHHSETEMLRYLKSLENKDLSLGTFNDCIRFLHYETKCDYRDDTCNLA